MSLPQLENRHKETYRMKIAIPVAEGRLSPHFGHCEEFRILEADQASGRVLRDSTHKAPPHEPGVLPRWLGELGAEVIIAQGMGQRAQQLFEENGIAVVVGAPVDTPDRLATAYLTGSLQAGKNICDH
jgi:predicted Fe-Mo cluster-binding NifX family protein